MLLSAHIGCVPPRPRVSLGFLAPLVLAGLVGASCSKPPVPPPVPVRPFNGKDLTGWSYEGNDKRHFWKVGGASPKESDPEKLQVSPIGADLASDDIVGSNLYTQQTFSDCDIEVDVLLPAKSNSGIFVMGEYEVQLLDDPTTDPLKPTDMDHGAIARTAAPKVLVQAKPGTWQHVEIRFQAPRFDTAGTKISSARFLRVAINGQVVQENLDVQEPTAGGLRGEEGPAGPLMLQGSEGPVAFRNLVIQPRM